MYKRRLRLSISLALIAVTITGILATVVVLPAVHAGVPDQILWTSKTPVPYSVAQAGVVGGLDGRIYVMGGYSDTSFNTPISSASTYDPRTNTWSTLALLPTAVRGPAIAVDSKGLIYVITGYGSGGDIYSNQVYNATSNTWSSGTAIPAAVWMPGAATGSDGRIYVAGGEMLGSQTSSSALQIYNPQNKTWKSGANMITARKQLQMVAASNGLLYAIGGMSSSDIALTNVEAYNITSNTWTAKASLPSAVMDSGATLGPDGLIYVFGGSNYYSNNYYPYYNSVYSYYPPTNKWYTVNQTLPTARKELSAATSNYNSRMYVIGGANGAILSTNEEAQLPVGQSTSTTVTCHPASVIANNATSCTAIVVDTSATPTTPTGTVSFATSGTGTFSGTCSLIGLGNNSTCTSAVTYTPTAVGTGTHIIRGTYSGDSTHGFSISEGSRSFTLTVTARTTSTSVSCAPSSVIVNGGSSCTATVSDTSTSGTAATPTGLLTFTYAGTSTGSFSPSTNCFLSGGTCTATFTPSSAGTSTVTGHYWGDGMHAISSGTSGGITSTLRTDSIAMTCHPTTNMVSNYTSCTVTVTDTSPSPPLTPSGSIIFSSSGTGTFTSCALAGSNGVGTCTTHYTATLKGTGTHIVTAYYSGDAAHSAANPNATLTLTITNLIRSVTGTVSCTSPATIGIANDCTVTVTDSSPGAYITPTGQVTLTTSGAGSFVGTCTLSGTSATSTCSVTYTPGGTTPSNDLITFNYPGDTNHTAKSGSFLLVVDTPSSSGGANAQPQGVPTFYWIIVALGVVGAVLLAGYMVMLKNKKKQQRSPFSPGPRLSRGPSTSMTPPAQPANSVSAVASAGTVPTTANVPPTQSVPPAGTQPPTLTKRPES